GIEDAISEAGQPTRKPLVKARGLVAARTRCLRFLRVKYTFSFYLQPRLLSEGQPMREAVIIDCLRTAVGKSPRGALRHSRPDDPAAKEDVEDVILGCAMPEGEAGGNMARQAALRAGLPDSVPAMTINRYCS